MRLNASRFGRVESYVCCVVLGLMPVGRDAAEFDVPLVPCLSTGDATDAHTPPSADTITVVRKSRYRVVLSRPGSLTVHPPFRSVQEL